MGYALKGVTVTVSTPTHGSQTDPFGAPIAGAPSTEAVDDVIVDNPSDSDIEQTTRQYGVQCDFVLHFPKAHHGSLRGCSVTLPAPWSCTCEVLGDPMPYDPKLTPGRHNRRVHARRVVG